jgi:hypothetical protein
MKLTREAPRVVKPIVQKQMFRNKALELMRKEKLKGWEVF